MKKISLKLNREIISALVNVCRSHMETKSGDALFDLWKRETITEILLKIAKLRNRTAQIISVTFRLEEILCVRELVTLHEEKFPTSYEVLMLKEYFLNRLHLPNV